MGIIHMPLLFISSKFLYQPVKIWIKGIFFLLEKIAKIKHEIRGLDNIPSSGVLIASKHQSAFETFALFYYLSKPIFIHKKQLFWIPIFGQYLKKINMISIDRNEGISAIRKILKIATNKISEGHSVIIFPEGTRTRPGQTPIYKSGFLGIYTESNCSIIPVALNSGHFWPKHSFIKQPGKIIIKILNPIPPKLEKTDVLKKIELVIEDETNKLLKLK
tara:strand:+ start:278 stop:931 length:654 start_codon:yes stop_codon:yes gene_type:complete